MNLRNSAELTGVFSSRLTSRQSHFCARSQGDLLATYGSRTPARNAHRIWNRGKPLHFNDVLQVVVGRDPTVASNGLSSSIETPLGGVAGAGRWCAAGGRCGCRRVLFNRVTGRTACGARPLRIRSAPAAAAEQAPGARSCGRAGHDQGEGARVICLHPPLFAPTPIAILPPPHSQMRACSLHLH